MLSWFSSLYATIKQLSTYREHTEQPQAGNFSRHTMFYHGQLVQNLKFYCNLVQYFAHKRSVYLNSFVHHNDNKVFSML